MAMSRFVDKTKFYYIIKASFQQQIDDMLRRDASFNFFTNMVKQGELPRAFLEGVRNRTIAVTDQKLAKGAFACLLQAFDLFEGEVKHLVLSHNRMDDHEFA